MVVRWSLANAEVWSWPQMELGPCSPLFEPPQPQTRTTMQPTRALAAKNNLLICLDAFGTLFTPTRSVAATYAETAARHGVPTGGAENARLVGDRFKTAFKGEAKRNPVFGKATGLGAEKWWGNVSFSCATCWI
jgi:hypothetical protein